MQAVILAAGRGARMGALTDMLPKALLEIRGRTLLEWKLDALPPEVDEVIIIVGYFGSKIHEQFSGEFRGKRIFYIEQEALDGTAGALWKARDLLHDRFLVLNGDDIYAPEDIATMAAQEKWSVLGLRVKDLAGFGTLDVDAHGIVKGIHESGAIDASGGYVSTGLFTLDTSIFESQLVPKSPGSSENGLPQTILASGHHLHMVTGHQWLPVNDPADLQKAEEFLA